MLFRTLTQSRTIQLLRLLVHGLLVLTRLLILNVGNGTNGNCRNQQVLACAEPWPSTVVSQPTRRISTRMRAQTGEDQSDEAGVGGAKVANGKALGKTLHRC